jgi:hypothetical protein
MTQLYDEQKHPLTRRIFHWVMALSILGHDRQRLAHLQRQPDLPLHIPRVDHARR